MPAGGDPPGPSRGSSRADGGAAEPPSRPSLEIPAPQEGATEGELVGVLQVGADREPAGEPGHPDPAAHEVGLPAKVNGRKGLAPASRNVCTTRSWTSTPPSGA